MLYISRYIGEYLYGVADTDTDKELSLTMSQLYDLSKKCEIKGVDSRGLCGPQIITKYGRVRLQKDVLPIPWQSDDSMTTAQCKALVFRPYLSIKLYKGKIVHIGLIGKELPSNGASVRLSDFANYIGSCVFRRCLMLYNYTGRNRFTLIFDDDIDIEHDSFSSSIGSNGLALNYRYAGVEFDIREVTNKALARKIYGSVYRNSSSTDDFCVISDSDDRKAYYLKYYTALDKRAKCITKVMRIVFAPIRWIVQGVDLLYELLFLPKFRPDGFI